MNLVLFGPPGSGKGTQAQFLTESNLFLHISTGDLLRNEVKRDTLLGKQVKDIMDKGIFVSDDILLDLVRGALKTSNNKHIIFDGFPRTERQAYLLDELLKLNNSKVDLVVDFEVDLGLLLDRISGRYTCRDCGAVYNDLFQKPKVAGICDRCGGENFVKRQDDSPDVLKNRIHRYLNETEVVKNYYINKNLLVKINASNNPDDVRSELDSCIRQAGFDF